MDHAITVGEVVYLALVILGGLGIVGAFVWMLSVMASGFDH